MSGVAQRVKRRIPTRPRRPPAPVRKRPLSAGAAGAETPEVSPHLSPREREIVALLIGGCSVKEAAGTLGLSPRTVEGYLDRLKTRFEQPRLLALVVQLVKQGLVE